MSANIKPFLQIEWSKSDVNDFMRTMRRAEKELNMSTSSAVAWAASLIARSLSAATKTAPKARRIVKNPNKKAATDRRRAPFGVMAYDRSGKKVFRPIYRTGEYGKLRFFDKKSVSWYERDKGGGSWNKIQSGPDIGNPNLVAPGIKTDKRRLIGRRGMAKKAWRWAATRTRNGGTANLMRVPNVARVTITGKNTANPKIRIDNNLRYAGAAFKSGGAVNEAIAKAQRKMAHEIERRVAKKLER